MENMNGQPFKDHRLQMEFDIHEDIWQELEDFIYLARLGCIQEARDLYKELLEPFQYQCFPILAEFLDMLMVIKDYSGIRALLMGHSFEKFSHPEQSLLFQTRSFAARRSHEKDLMDLELLTFRGSELNLNWQDQMAALESCIIHVTADDFDAIIFNHCLIDLWTLSSGSQPDLERFFPMYERCCKHLSSISYYWEARQLFQLFAQLDRATASVYLGCFRNTIDSRLSEQAAKLALLAVLTNYISSAEDYEIQGADQTVTLAKEMYELLQYFFPEPSERRGLHHDVWMARFGRDKTIGSAINSDIAAVSEPRVLTHELTAPAIGAVSMYGHAAYEQLADIKPKYSKQPTATSVTSMQELLSSSNSVTTNTISNSVPSVHDVANQASISKVNLWSLSVTPSGSSRSHRFWYCCGCQEGPKSLSYEKKCTSCGHRVCFYCKTS